MLALLHFSLHLGAQTKAPPQSASCKIDTTEPSEADLAFAAYDIKKAAALYASAYTANTTDDRSRELEIQSLILEGKLDDARKKADTWTATSATNAYAILAASDVRFAEGDWPEAYGIALKAVHANPCLAPAYAALYRFELAAGYRVTAARSMNLAHQLEPNNQSIRFTWIGSLTTAQRLAESQKYLEDSKAIPEKRRSALLHSFSRDAAISEAGCQLTSFNGEARIPMAAINTHGNTVWGLEVEFNHHKRLLQIDTGASGFTLTVTAVNGLGLHPVGQIRIGGIGSQGSNAAVLDRADTVTVGGLVFSNCIVESLSRPAAMGGSTLGYGERMDDTDGLVGTDIFSRYLVTLDYIRHEIRLAPLPSDPAHPTPPNQLDALGGRNDNDWMLADRYIPPSMKAWTSIYREGHMLIMPVFLSAKGKQGHPSLFIMDTGAYNNLVDINTAKEFTHVDDTADVIFGLSGAQRIFKAGSFDVDFAGIRLPVKSMPAAYLNAFGGVTGFLGYPTLQQFIMQFDYRDNLVKVQYGQSPEPAHVH
ncbi:MAG: aspartyl protease family protein [Acidobacteriota bacterium]